VYYYIHKIKKGEGDEVKYHIESITKEELEGKSRLETYYAIPEVAKIMKKSEEQTRRNVREGKIQAYKEWKSYYILETDLREYMISDDRVKIEIYEFFKFEYEHRVKHYHPSADEVFKGAMQVLVSLLTDFGIALRDSIIEELKSMYL